MLLLVLKKERDEMNRDFVLKTNAPFIFFISEINGVLIENAEDLDVVMPMYNLLEYNKYYSKTSGSLWNYYRDELTPEINNNNGLNKNIINSKSFKYKTSITGSTYNIPSRVSDEDGNLADIPDYIANKRGKKEAEIAVPLKYLPNFYNSLNIPLVNCEVSLSWSATCAITSMEKRILVAGQPDRGGSPTNTTFKIIDTKFYVPVDNLSAENNDKLLEKLKAEFKKTIKRSKYRSEISNQTKNNNLNYLIDPTFTKVNRLFVLLFENEVDRTSYEKYYVPIEEVYEAIIEMCKNNDYTTGSLSDCECFSKHYELIAINLSKQIELENPDLKQQINFIGRLEQTKVQQ